VLGDYVGALVAAARGDGDRSAAAAASLAALAVQTGTEIAAVFAHHLRGLSASARGDFDSAYQHVSAISAAGELTPYAPHALWVLFDLVEAAMKTNRVEQARAHVDAMRRANVARLSSRLALIYFACTAMSGPSDEARAMFDKALAIPGASRWQFDYARVQLVYAEHLRTRQSLTEASRNFDMALRTFEGLGAEPWTARAGKGLRATHSMTHGWRDTSGSQLSAQDRQIAALAAAGLTNREIGERLHMSHRTVGGRLYRIFPVLGITSRAALHAALVGLTDE
jgi:ATP/maltotriose-dependent transcriptional regulator MalT